MGSSMLQPTFAWSRRWDSNPQPAVYKTAALPIELRRQRLALAATVMLLRSDYSDFIEGLARSQPGDFLDAAGEH